MKTTLDDLEEEYWQLFVAFSTGDRETFKRKFRASIYNITSTIRSEKLIEPDQKENELTINGGT